MSDKREKAKRTMMAGLESSDSYSSSDTAEGNEDVKEKSVTEVSESTSEGDSRRQENEIREPVVRKLLEIWDQLYPYNKKKGKR